MLPNSAYDFITELELVDERWWRTWAPGWPGAMWMATAMTTYPRGSMGLSVGEIGTLTGHADGLPDLFITHWVAQENALYQSLLVQSSRLEYRDKTRQLRLGEISIDVVGWGCAMTDLDLDGRVDLIVANGSTLEQKEAPEALRAEPLFVLWNDGHRYVDVATRAGAATQRRYVARGLAVADFDRDGDVDVAVSVNRGSLLLLRNETPRWHRSLSVILNGPDAARFGARIKVSVAGHDQYRWWGSDVSYLGNHSAEAIFGLGTADVAEVVSVTWADGQVTEQTNVTGERLILSHAEQRR